MELLGDRLDWTVYTPVGLEWFTEGYWAFDLPWDPGALARQYIDLNGSWQPLAHGKYETLDGAHPDRPIYGVTLEAARRMDWGLVIATLQQNQAGFARFAREMGAKYVLQVGNTGQQIDWDLDPLVLNSSEMPMLGRGVHYHQEFDSRRTFRFREPSGEKVIRSFVHLLPETVCWPVWQAFREAMPDFDFVRYGHAPTIKDPSYAGNINPVSAIADLMSASSWGWHDKPHGDGFGHVLHNWAAVGRPLIGHGHHYQGKQGAIFWRDLETCIDLDRHPQEEAIELIRELTGTPRHAEMCRAIREVFDREVDYEGEAQMIGALLT